MHITVHEMIQLLNRFSRLFYFYEVAGNLIMF